jgi:transducin (beta)-like 1
MKDGSSQTTLNQHQGPVFAIKWNPKGTFLATGSVDMSTLIWDPQTSEVKQKLEMHKGTALAEVGRECKSAHLLHTTHLNRK